MRPIGSSRQCVLAALVSVFFAMPGCHSGSSDDAASGGCSEFASTVCAKTAACSPLELRLTYGDEATCVRRTELSCAPFADLPGTSWTPAKLNSCAQAYAAAACSTPVDSIPECTLMPGSLATGAKCASSTQCATVYCNLAGVPLPVVDGGSSCGTCEVPSVPPLQCGDAGACVAPELCLSDGTGGVRCRRLSQEGEGCGAQVPCGGGLACIASVCAHPKPAGASCVEPGECDLSQSLLCINSTCQMPTWVEPGSPCRAPDQLCSGGACVGGGIDATSPATCMAWAADGSPCDEVKGPPCLLPAICLAGKCQMLDLTCR
jgi:hypothetical protein